MTANPAGRTLTVSLAAGATACGILLFFGAITPKASAFQPPAPAEEHSKLLKQYCISCHNNKLKTANLTLEGLDLSKVADNAGTWETVLRKLNAKQMPPTGLPAPAPAAEKSFTTYLETELDRAAAGHPNPGRPTIHRLNRNEYSNVVRDLLALDIKPGNQLPLDDTGYGFDDIGDVLSLSPVLIERYMSVGRQVARLAVGDTDVKPVVDTFAPVKEMRAASKGGPKVPRNEKISEDLPFDSAGGASFDYTFPVDANYLFKVKMPAPAAGFGETAAPVGQVLELKVPVKAGVHHVGLTFMKSSAVAETVPAFGFGRAGAGGGGGRGANAPPPPVAHMDLRLDGARLKLYDVVEVGLAPSFSELAIAGPYDITGSGDSPSHKKIFTCTPTSASQESACARKILTQLTRRAYRRPITDADLKPILAFYDTGRKEKDFTNGIELALRAILVSPNFLFRVEHDPAGAAPGSIHRVNDYELASRLSFFLWSSMPDDELLTLADQGKLRDSKVVEAQVARMVEDPKSKAFVSNFAGQWLFLRNLDQVKPDPDEFPEFDNNLRRAFQKETELFFNSIFRENRPISEFLDAKYTYVNQRLAEFYGIPNVYGTQFRKVALNDDHRGGLLGQGSILTVTSYPNRTSVVQRGKWILENMLGTPPPAPPPNVPPLEAHGKDGKQTMRQAMEEHRANPVCASCHAKMDPLGFALENYTGIGEWRDKDNGVTIDASGKLPDGAVFTGAGGLRQALIGSYRDAFISTFTEKLMTYALGRGIEPYDRPAMRAVIREAEKHNTTIPALINAIIASPEFQMRKTKESL